VSEPRLGRSVVAWLVTERRLGPPDL
jgi:hypothetical protein